MIRILIITTLLMGLFACEEETIPSITLSGNVELLDEYAERLSDHSGVTIKVITDHGEKFTETDVDGDFHIDLLQSDYILEVTYEKDGFASRQFTDNFEQVEGLVKLVQISTIEVDNLEAVEMDCGSTTCFNLSFDAHNFYTDQTDKRYFYLHAYHNNQLVGTLRFFSFQETVYEANQVTPISTDAARVQVEISGLWFLSDFATNTEIELRVYGATSFETYLNYDLETLVDNSINTTHGSTIVKML